MKRRSSNLEQMSATSTPAPDASHSPTHPASPSPSTAGIGRTVATSRTPSLAAGASRSPAPLL